jgi:RND family efflux transporter MFP subunit
MKAFFVKNYIAVGIVILVIAAGGAYWYVRSAAPPTFGTATVEMGNVIASVDESGSVRAENSAVVSFQVAGQIAHVYASEGSVVSAGTVLADLDSSQLNAAAAQANAALAGAQAQLALLQSGTRPEQLAIDTSAVASADRSLGIAVGNAYSASDDAVRNQLDNMFSSPQSSNPAFLVPSNNGNSQTINEIQNQRVKIGVALSQWYGSLSATSTGFDPVTLSTMTMANLEQIESYIDTIALVLNGATPNPGVSATMLAQYKGNIATARAEIEASISAISGNQSALTAAQNQLALAQAGTTPQAIQAQEAAVAAAQAAVSSAQVALGHTSLVAPFSGTVQSLTAQTGQVVAPGAPMMSLINNSGLKIETYVSQADVAKIKTGDAASVTLDAFGPGTTFAATVSTIDAAQTQVNGSAAYMVTLHFIKSDSRLKDGMTGNVRIVEAEHDDVLVVPSNLIVNDAGNYFVSVQNGAIVKKESVTIGLVGNNGTTEITSGLHAGDVINNF